MDLRLGLVGRGYWGNVWAKVLTDSGIEFWQAGRDWKERPRPDGLIIASSTGTHFQVAMDALDMGLPVLIEKPVCLNLDESHALIGKGGIVYACHTRLHDSGWERFKKTLPREVKKVEVWAGGMNETNPDFYLNWIHHVIPMVQQIGCWNPILHISNERQPVRLVVNDEYEFKDGPPGALKNLLGKFCAAVKARPKLDNWGAYETYLVNLYIKEQQCPSRITPP